MMEKQSMTALVSAFARWHHSARNAPVIFDDPVAGLLISEAERQGISMNMQRGIGFFNPAFEGTGEEALRWIVDNQLSPSPLGRAAFCERHLKIAASLGARQYLILAAGYDTFAYRQPDWAADLQIFEIDHPATAQDKRARLAAAEIAIPENTHYVAADFTDPFWCEALARHLCFDRDRISFCSLLGISYYLTKDTFDRLLCTLSAIMPKGSSIVFDYPDQDSYTALAGERAKKQAALAGGANESMLASYSFGEMERLLERHSLLAYEHLMPDEITAQYFHSYNAANPAHPITAFDNVNYCLAIKQ